MYMEATPSPYTKETIKAWKGMLDSESFVAAGRVHDLTLHLFNTNASSRFLIKWKVKHSQRLMATPLLPWAVIEENGSVLVTHCTCMAGLGEACSHIAAILTCVVHAAERRRQSGENSCTSRSCYWLPPSKDVIPANISDINFENPRKRQKQVHTGVSTSTSIPPKIAPPSTEELDTFYASINQANIKPAILRITPPYANDFVPKLSSGKFPKLITELYNPAALHIDYISLLEMCEKEFESIKISPDEAAEVEKETRGQAEKKCWFTFRAGRITASVMKLVARTNQLMPSQSLIKRICNPELFHFSTNATRWGCEHEKDALDVYSAKAKQHHANLSVTPAGFVIDLNKPFIGASPDAFVECSCCNQGVVEVKCPQCIKDRSPEEIVNFCMVNKDGKWSLKQDHSYFYQVQTQLQVCKRSYCDFVVSSETGIIEERIDVDEDFFNSLENDVQHFFIYGILPEIIGKWYTRAPIANSSGIVPAPKSVTDSHDSGADDEDYDQLWCYCNQPSYGFMISCDNDSCPIEWFHGDCLRIRKPPKGKWYCPSCRKLPNKDFKNKKK